MFIRCCIKIVAMQSKAANNSHQNNLTRISHSQSRNKSDSVLLNWSILSHVVLEPNARNLRNVVDFLVANHVIT